MIVPGDGHDDADARFVIPIHACATPGWLARRDKLALRARPQGGPPNWGSSRSRIREHSLVPPDAALPPHCASNLPSNKTVNPVGRTQRGRARVRAMATQQTTSSSARTPATALERAFERKVWLGKWALLFEQLWPRAWLVLGLAWVFIALSLAGGSA